MIDLPKRTTTEYLEWDPNLFNDEFKLLCLRVQQYIKLHYDLEFSNFEIHEFYRICKMNKGIFLTSIHNDESPFLEYVRLKRSKPSRM